MRKTRKERVTEVMSMVIKGPDINFLVGVHLKPELREEIESRYHMWSRTWIVPELVDLIPELKNLSNQEVIKQFKVYRKGTSRG